MNPFPYTLWIIVQFVIGYHLILPLFQYFFYKIIPHRKPQSKIFIKEPDYAIIVTAYEQVDTVPAAVASLLKMNYSNYLIYLVADKCDVSALKFSDERVIILRPEETLGSNTRSHFYAIQRFRRDH